MAIFRSYVSHQRVGVPPETPESSSRRGGKVTKGTSGKCNWPAARIVAHQVLADDYTKYIYV